MAWFKKARTPIAASKEKPSRVPEGLWVKCPGCSQAIYNKDLAASLNVCPKCGHHFRVGAAERLRMLFDDGQWVEHDQSLKSTDPLEFTDTKPYKARLRTTIEQTGMNDALLAGTALTDSAGASRAARGELPESDAAMRLVATIAPTVLDMQRELSRLGAVEGDLAEQLGRARFEVYGRSIPPDGTFSPRVADGVVQGYAYNGTLAC